MATEKRRKGSERVYPSIHPSAQRGIDMAFDISNSLYAVKTYVQDLGLFQSVQIGEPKQTLGQGFHASVFMESVGVTAIYIGGDTRESHVVNLRIYKNMLSDQSDPQNSLEIDMAVTVSKLMGNILGDTDLESSIMSIDAAGMDGGGMGADYGYADVGGTLYRIADITIPLIVNGSATLVGTGV